jgi:adenylate cyclase
LFVDIRGYSRYSEGRSVTDVFSTVNRYTQLVSAAVTKYGGSVVEFNGDGMMVLFGAPQPMIDKELRAVEAALQIHQRMALLRTHARSATLSVGIGIATGPACVGSVRAVDRWIWTALGETTNRASRLQGLTRELDAEIVIDETTWRRSIPRQDLFVALHEQALRGLRRKQDVFIKPIPQRLSQDACAANPSA